MNIAFCTGWGVEKDGIADYSRHLCAALGNMGVGIEILKLGFYIGEEKYYRDLAQRANKADVCHVQFNYVYFNGELPYRNRFLEFTRNLTVPLIMTCHEVRIGFKHPSGGFSCSLTEKIFNTTLPAWNLWSENMHRRIYAQASAIIVHSSVQAVEVKRLLHNQERVRIIPHPIPAITDNGSYISADAAKRIFGLTGKVVLSIFGFINSRKGYELVISILPQLPGDVSLLIAGGRMTDTATDRGYEEHLRCLINDKHLEDRIRISGYLDASGITAAMAASDLCLSTSTGEAGSGALSLCLAYHKPVIASDTAVNREINERIRCLELFRTGDQQALFGRNQKSYV